MNIFRFLGAHEQADYQPAKANSDRGHLPSGLYPDPSLQDEDLKRAPQPNQLTLSEC